MLTNVFEFSFSQSKPAGEKLVSQQRDPSWNSSHTTAMLEGKQDNYGGHHRKALLFLSGWMYKNQPRRSYKPASNTVPHQDRTCMIIMAFRSHKLASKACQMHLSIRPLHNWSCYTKGAVKKKLHQQSQKRKGGGSRDTLHCARSASAMTPSVADLRMRKLLTFWRQMRRWRRRFRAKRQTLVVVELFLASPLRDCSRS